MEIQSEADNRIEKLKVDYAKERNELEKARIQAAVSEKKARSARAEADTLREMNAVLQKRGIPRKKRCIIQ